MRDNHMRDDHTREEAIAHIISSAKYWAGDNFDPFSYLSNLGLENAFDVAVEHVRRSHYSKLTEEDIDIARKKLKL